MSDINGGAGFPNANGSPLLPGTTFVGPLIAGNIPHSDGSGALAALGATGPGTANAGYVVMAQSAVVSQTTTAGQSAGVFVSSIVIPAQSQIVRILLMVTTVWTTATTTLGVGASVGTTNATAFTAAANLQGSTLGQVSGTPTTAAQIANWDNVSNATFQASGPVDVQIIITSGGGIGGGVGTLTVEYLQGINMAS
jgi:hypothetical protein